jgi:hypothetical protein
LRAKQEFSPEPIAESPEPDETVNPFVGKKSSIRLGFGLSALNSQLSTAWMFLKNNRRIF